MFGLYAQCIGLTGPVHASFAHHLVKVVHRARDLCGASLATRRRAPRSPAAQRWAASAVRLCRLGGDALDAGEPRARVGQRRRSTLLLDASRRHRLLAALLPPLTALLARTLSTYVLCAACRRLVDAESFAAFACAATPRRRRRRRRRRAASRPTPSAASRLSSRLSKRKCAVASLASLGVFCALSANRSRSTRWPESIAISLRHLCRFDR